LPDLIFFCDPHTVMLMPDKHSRLPLGIRATSEHTIQQNQKHRHLRFAGFE